MVSSEKMRKKKLIQTRFQEYEDFAEKLGEAIFNFFNRHYNV